MLFAVLILYKYVEYFIIIFNRDDMVFHIFTAAHFICVNSGASSMCKT